MKQSLTTLCLFTLAKAVHLKDPTHAYQHKVMAETGVQWAKVPPPTLDTEADAIEALRLRILQEAANAAEGILQEAADAAEGILQEAADAAETIRLLEEEAARVAEEQRLMEEQVAELERIRLEEEAAAAAEVERLRLEEEERQRVAEVAEAERIRVERENALRSNPVFNYCCQSNPGTWTLVRRVESGSNWHPANDNLRGVETYGTPCGSTEDCTFAIPFEQEDFDEFMVATGDGTHWMIMKKDQVYTFGSNFNLEIESSYLRATPSQALMYNRANVSADPFLSAVDHHGATHVMLYAEDSTHWHTTSLTGHNGANVYVRMSSAVE